MLAAHPQLPPTLNEPILNYAPGSPERKALRAALADLSAQETDIPLWINGRAVRPGKTEPVSMPHRHAHIVGRCHQGGEAETQAAIEAALFAKRDWERTPWTTRAAILLKAAELLATRKRALLNAATMAGQSKTAHQAEVDAACELIDFWRFNVQFLHDLMAQQPLSGGGVWNMSDYRPLEGFVYAVTPFNFTAIGGNLATAPALLGNTVVWKPAPTAALSAHFVMEILHEAGLPPGVINVVYGAPEPISRVALASPHLAGIHFTGSTGVFQQLWRSVGENIARYRTYPRLVGETGGKDFIVAHASANVEALAVAIVRGGYEFQGQKCSAASRLYIPDSLWPKVKARVTAMIAEIKVGDVADFSNFMGAVIDRRAFDRIEGYLSLARNSAAISLLAGGSGDSKVGYFVQPTLVETTDPHHRLMVEEIFGPIVTAYVYKESEWEETLKLVDSSTGYALTGAIFANDRRAIETALTELRQAAGNVYINDKPTGAVVGQQPFGGARGSGTNDKAGSALNLLRWASPRTVKEVLVSPTDWRYPYLATDA